MVADKILHISWSIFFVIKVIKKPVIKLVRIYKFTTKLLQRRVLSWLWAVPLGVLLWASRGPAQDGRHRGRGHGGGAEERDVGTGGRPAEGQPQVDQRGRAAPAGRRVAGTHPLRRR
jgi:hypothetical protein